MRIRTCFSRFRTKPRPGKPSAGRTSAGAPNFSVYEHHSSAIRRQREADGVERLAAASDPRRAGRAETHEKWPQRPCWCREDGSVRPRSRDWHHPDLCAKRPDQPPPTLRASAVAVPPKHWFTRASGASPWWLGLPALAGCGSLPRPVGLRCPPSQLPRQTGRLDLCSRHQHGSADQSSCFVIRVTQLCRISQVSHELAWDSRWVAIAATHAPSDLSLVLALSIQRVSWHA